MVPWPTPVLKPMSHFMIGGVITFYLVNKMQTAMLKSPEYAKDPRNPHVSSLTFLTPLSLSTKINQSRSKVLDEPIIIEN
ncbi:hypothetical protein PSHT_07127 [Puccinia striiformis]|uniref:Uncharacterized protein n=1 Tax=Puccinia striiformis TaxID=27350 RepID=A0A2S4W083_9BASI|nr:hypothetical protein PSHT_07127 [Puccinia striiformis]